MKLIVEHLVDDFSWETGDEYFKIDDSVEDPETTLSDAVVDPDGNLYSVETTAGDTVLLDRIEFIGILLTPLNI